LVCLAQLRLDIAHVILPLVYFFFIATATTELYTLSLHDALPISLPTCRETAPRACRRVDRAWPCAVRQTRCGSAPIRYPPRRRLDRKSTRLNSSHVKISYAVFCLKKKK